MNIAGLPIKRPVFVVMIVASIITLGLIGYVNIPVDLLPSIEQPSLYVSTSYPGASAEDIENIVTKPLENALGTVEGLDTLTSRSREGFSQISVNFRLGVDIKFAELKVREKVQAVTPQFPDDVNDPVIRKFSTDDRPIMTLSIAGPRELFDLRDIVENDIQPRLETLGGVGSISISGARKRIVTISLNESLLSANGVSYRQVKDVITAKNVSLPVGTVRGEDRNISVRVLGRAESVNDIADIQFTTAAGKILRIRDVARVEFGIEDEQTRARVNGTNAVLFSVSKQSGANTVRVAATVRDALDVLQTDLPAGISLRVVSDSSVIINRSIRGVQDDILLGALLAILVVWLFLSNFRSTLITASVLPSSLLGAFFLAFVLGFSLNTMTLLALSIAIGLLVDDAIVVCENIHRKIEQGSDPKTAAAKGTNEVALAVFSTTLTILAVFIPISFMQGAIGQLFKEFGLMVAFALAFSLLNALTAAPMLSAYWYKKTKKRTQNRFLRFFRLLSDKWNAVYEKISAFYKRLLAWGLDHKLIILFITLGLFGLSLAGSRFIGSSFMSGGDSSSYSINLEVAPGSPLDAVDRFVLDVEKYLTTKDYIESFYSSIGRGGSHQAEINVDLKALKDRSISTRQAIGEARAYIRSKFEAQIVYRISERNVSIPGFGGGSNLSLNIAGKDLKTLQEVMNSVIGVLNQTPGVSDIDMSLKPGAPELVVRLDRLKAEKLGITETWLAGVLRDLVQGSTVSTPLSYDGKDFFIVIRLSEPARNEEADFMDILITTPAGKKAPLSSFAQFTYMAAPLEIRRESKSRIVRVSANLEPGYSLSDVIAMSRQNIDKNVVMPEGYSYVFTGQQKSLTDLVGQIVFAIALALLFMYMILASLYNSFIQPFIIMLSIPLAIIGAFLALLIVNIDLDIYGYIGLLLVLGLVTKNAILLIDFANSRRKEGATIREAILAAGPVRLRPILMTSFSTIFGMLPLALGLNEGSSGRQALPIAVIGGMLTSTFLTLVVIPVVYEIVEKWFEKLRHGKKAKKQSA